MELLSFKLVLPNFKVHALSFLSSKMQGDTHLFLLFFLRPQWPGECSLKRHARVPNLWLWLAFAVSFSITCLTSSPNNDYYLEFHKDTKFHPSSLLPSLPISFFLSLSLLLVTCFLILECISSTLIPLGITYLILPSLFFWLFIFIHFEFPSTLFVITLVTPDHIFPTKLSEP